MFKENLTYQANFFVIGINYKKTDALLRGQYAINEEKYLALLSQASSFNIHEFFVLSTCNRTEIYGYAEDALALSRLLCTQSEGSFETFSAISYTKKGTAAFNHLFDVAAGLDSQILGDYEIVGQLKKAFKLAKENNGIGPNQRNKKYYRVEWRHRFCFICSNPIY